MLNNQLSLRDRVQMRLREWRRAIKSTLPYVRRRVYRITQRRNDEIAKATLAGLERADTAHLRVVKGVQSRLGGDVCFFVTHAPRAALKPHVTLHAQQLMDAGVHVILIVNTDLTFDQLALDAALVERLAACVVRQNVGLDFAAWAHAWMHFGPAMSPDRLMLVNDSIVGPLDAVAYRTLLRRVRESAADVVGLTENFDPCYHLQSFFLVFNKAALASSAWRNVFDRLVNLPTKDLVINVYETRLTGHLMQAGLTCEALFPTPARSVYAPPNDTTLRWTQLVAAGFPFVKASVLAERSEDPDVERLVPAVLRPRA